MVVTKGTGQNLISVIKFFLLQEEMTYQEGLQ